MVLGSEARQHDGYGEIGGHDDGGAISSAAAGDRHAFDALYQQHRQRIFNLALRSTGNIADAEDVCQDVWTRVHKNIGGLRAIGAFDGWLTRITTRACIDAARKRHPNSFDESEIDKLPGDADLADRAVDEEDRSLAWQALGSLAPRQRIALYLREVEDRDYRQIAAALCTSESAVETLLFRARQSLGRSFQTLQGSPEERCKRARHLMAVVVDGEGDRAEEKSLKAHLHDCDSCQRAMFELKRGKAAYGALPFGLSAGAARFVLPMASAGQGTSLLSTLKLAMLSLKAPAFLAPVLVATTLTAAAVVAPQRLTTDADAAMGGQMGPVQAQAVAQAPLIGITDTAMAPSFATTISASLGPTLTTSSSTAIAASLWSPAGISTASVTSAAPGGPIEQGAPVETAQAPAPPASISDPGPVSGAVGPAAVVETQPAPAPPAPQIALPPPSQVVSELTAPATGTVAQVTAALPPAAGDVVSDLAAQTQTLLNQTTSVVGGVVNAAAGLTSALPSVNTAVSAAGVASVAANAGTGGVVASVSMPGGLGVTAGVTTGVGPSGPNGPAAASVTISSPGVNAGVEVSGPSLTNRGGAAVSASGNGTAATVTNGGNVTATTGGGGVNATTSGGGLSVTAAAPTSGGGSSVAAAAPTSGTGVTVAATGPSNTGVTVGVNVGPTGVTTGVNVSGPSVSISVPGVVSVHGGLSGHH